jgi:hypothetical protein
VNRIVRSALVLVQQELDDLHLRRGREGELFRWRRYAAIARRPSTLDDERMMNCPQPFGSLMRIPSLL